MSTIKTLTDQAINQALSQHWSEAIALNLQILAQVPNHIPTLNRLANAYLENGQADQATATYQQVLCIDRFNAIASKNLTRISNRSPHANQLHQRPCSDHIAVKLNTDFIEEPGKTKAFSLIRLGEAQLLNTLQLGQIVNLNPKSHTISVTTHEGAYLGSLTDDVSFQLKRCLDAGNTYLATVKSFSPTTLVIFIRETCRSRKLGNTPTFG